MPSSQTIIDYAIFASVLLAMLLALTVWLRRTGRADGMVYVAWSSCLILIVFGSFMVANAEQRERERLIKQIRGFAPTYAHELEAMGHERIQLTTAPDDPLYLSMIERQIIWQELNPAIADIYTFRQHPDGNQLFVDSETDYDRNNRIEGARESRTQIGEVWEEQNEFLVRAYAGEPVFDDTIYTDRWGTWVSAYVPMKNANGELDAVLGVDFPAAEWKTAIRQATRMIIGYLSTLATIILASTAIIAVLRSNLAERRKSEAQLREVALRTRLIIDSSYSAFVACDQTGKIIDWNPKAETIFGWKRDEALEQYLHETIVPPSNREAHVAGMQRYLKDGKPRILNQLLEMTAARKDGYEFPVELTITPICVGGETTFFAFLHDISERKEAEAALLRAKEDAEAATRAKSEFLANMSHEIRTPMNGIIGMSELLANTKLDVQQKDYLEMVRVSAQSLLRLLNDILDFSKIEAGKLELEHVDFGLRDCVTKAAQTLASRAAQKGVELACRIDPAVPDLLIGDPGRLGQIIVNLVGNAVKFTETGEVVVDVEIQSVSDDDVHLLFSVKDTGVGIPADKQEKIFEVFDQADASTTRRFGGTGLGLAISQQLVELMRGEIWVESELNVGSTFKFSAHFGISSALPLDEAEVKEQLAGERILVVDDNETNLKIFVEILKSWEMESLTAVDGPSALNKLRIAAERDNPVRLVISDCMMPDMDGFELAEKIRDDDSIPKCAVVMVSSGAGPDDAEKCKKLGITRYMLKPVIQSELRQTILSVVAESTTQAQKKRPTGADAPDFQPLNILLVEDGLVNQKVAAGLLKDHQVSIVNNGREAVETLQEQSFDIVFMDVQMPEMDGFEATRAIRKMEKNRGERTPIIAMTASAMKGDREKCLAAGMDSYVSKPVTAEQLHSEIAKIAAGIDKKKSTLSSAPASASSAETNRNIEPSSKTASLNMINFGVALDRVGGDEDELKAIAGLMIDQCPEMLDELRLALEKKNLKDLQRAAHTIKGTADVFDAKPIVEVAQEIESAAETGDLALPQAKLELLEQRMAELRGELTDLVGD